MILHALILGAAAALSGFFMKTVGDLRSGIGVLWWGFPFGAVLAWYLWIVLGVRSFAKALVVSFMAEAAFYFATLGPVFVQVIAGMANIHSRSQTQVILDSVFAEPSPADSCQWAFSRRCHGRGKIRASIRRCCFARPQVVCLVPPERFSKTFPRSNSFLWAASGKAEWPWCSRWSPTCDCQDLRQTRPQPKTRSSGPFRDAAATKIKRRHHGRESCNLSRIPPGAPKFLESFENRWIGRPSQSLHLRSKSVSFRVAGRVAGASRSRATREGTR